MKARILLAEDDPNIRLGLVATLESDGYAVTAAADGGAALRLFPQSKFDLVILDVMMPQQSGYEVCRALRARGEEVPVMLLTAKGEEIDKVVGFEVGAEDYVVKPFSTRELLLRVKAVLRRTKNEVAELPVIQVGGLAIDTERHKVTINGLEVAFTMTEFKLLHVLVKRLGRVQSRDTLLRDVWGYNYVEDTRTVDTHVTRLRTKMGEAGDMIKTVRGFGYKMEAR
jgi:two-component system, OmpR family, phosphate regulon response regulator PhoB